MDSSRLVLPLLAAVAIAALVACERRDAPTAGQVPAAVTAAPALTADPADSTDVDVLRFLVLAREGQSTNDVAASADRVFGAPSQVELLDPDVDDEELSRTYVVTPPSIDTARNPWDTAHALQTDGDFEVVEVERSDTLVPAFRHNAATLACALDGTDANEDAGWSLRKINAAEAWAMDPPGNGRRFGEGVSICHPDTGWTAHDDLDGLDLGRARNFIDMNDDARDPHLAGKLLNPGHGTATGSVIASDGGLAADIGVTGPGKITGVAPLATVVPLRTVKSVMQVLDSDVAKAVLHSVDAQCDVVSMSLGGRGFFGLRRAVRLANDNGLILVTASGNCVGTIVAPAAYDETVAVAATNDRDRPWKGSSRGRKIAISAPGENVWVANGSAASNLPADIRSSNGTSFATAEVAGAAAIWLAFHTREAVERAAGGKRISDLFVRVLRRSARKPDGWNAAEFGAGILDLEALLSVDINALGPSMAPAQLSAGNEAVSVLATVVDRDPADVAEALRVMLGDPADFDTAAARWVPELTDIAMRNPDEFQLALDRALADTAPAGGPPRVAAQRVLDAEMSDALRSATR